MRNQGRKFLLAGILFLCVLLVLFAILFLQKTAEKEEYRHEKVIVVQREDDATEEKKEQEQIQKDSDENSRNREEDMYQDTEDSEKNRVEQKKLASVNIGYEPTDDVAFLELLKGKENELKLFLAEKLSGNGVPETGEESYPKVNVIIQFQSQKKEYLTFLCKVNGVEIPMIYYKDSGRFFFRSRDSEPGRSNEYQEVTEGVKNKE